MTLYRLLVPALPALVVCTSLAEMAPAQRGGGGGRGFRGPSEAILSRSGSFFVDTTLPEPDPAGGRIALAACSFVEAARSKDTLSLLYLYDGGDDEEERAEFERAVFADPDVSVGLKMFLCARVDLAADAAAKAEFGRRAPLLIAFDAGGEPRGEVSLAGYKKQPSQVMKVLERAAARHGKLPLARFVERYRGFLADYQQWEARERLLQDKRRRVEAKDPSPADIAKIEREEEEMRKAEQDLLAAERELLEQANLPVRDGTARRLGDRRRGPRRE